MTTFNANSLTCAVSDADPDAGFLPLSASPVPPMILIRASKAPCHTHLSKVNLSSLKCKFNIPKRLNLIRACPNKSRLTLLRCVIADGCKVYTGSRFSSTASLQSPQQCCVHASPLHQCTPCMHTALIRLGLLRSSDSSVERPCSYGDGSALSVNVACLTAQSPSFVHDSIARNS